MESNESSNSIDEFAWIYAKVIFTKINLVKDIYSIICEKTDQALKLLSLN